LKEIRRTMGKKARQKKKTAQRNNDTLPGNESKYSDSESPQIEDGQANEASDEVIDLPSKRESALKEEIISLKVQLECAFRVHQMLQNVNEEQAKEILNLREQMEEGRKAEEDLKRKSLEKEEQHQVEVNILKGKIEEKDKLLRFQDSSKILDDILSSQRSPAIKTGLGFHESVESESSSQSKTRDSNAKSEMLNKEMKGQSHHQPRKGILQRKSFTPSMNNVECYECHNLGHIAARCRRRRIQDHHERSSHSRYFNGYCFACNMFGHKAVDCYRRNMRHVRCYACYKLGHIAKECKRRLWTPNQKRKTSSRLKIWKKKEVQPERCGIAEYTDMTEEAGSVEHQCSKSNTRIS
jgi:hypothetical protein